MTYKACVPSGGLPSWQRGWPALPEKLSALGLLGILPALDEKGDKSHLAQAPPCGHTGAGQAVGLPTDPERGAGAGVRTGAHGCPGALRGPVPGRLRGERCKGRRTHSTGFLTSHASAAAAQCQSCLGEQVGMGFQNASVLVQAK